MTKRDTPPLGQCSLVTSEVRGNCVVGSYPAHEVSAVRWFLGLGVAATIVTACSGGTTPQGEVPSDSIVSGEVHCLEPPASEINLASSLTMALDPNPVEAGAIATLSLSSDDPPYTYTDGAAAAWQCWDGTTWVATHQMLRDGYGGGGDRPVTLEVTAGATTTVPAIGLNVPNSYSILIPDVPPGTYRIIDDVGGANRQRLGGHVIVVVR